MRETENYSLKQPDYDDEIDIEVLNGNSEDIDRILKSQADEISRITPPDIAPIPNSVIERLFQ